MRTSNSQAPHFPPAETADVITEVSCQTEREALATLIHLAHEASWTQSSCHVNGLDGSKQHTRFDYFDADKAQKFVVSCSLALGDSSPAAPSYYASVSEPHGMLSALSITEASIIAPIFATLTSRNLTPPQS